MLLQEALPPRAKARDTLSGKADGLSNPEILAGLIRIVNPDFQTPSAGRTFNQQTSELRNCRSNGDTSYLPVGGKDFAHSFNELVESSLPLALERTRDFIDRFIDVDSKGLRLAQMLGTAINRDSAIAADQVVAPLPDGASQTKATLPNTDEACLDALILGAWQHVSNPMVRNTSGRDTFDRWHLPPSAPNSIRKFDMQAFNLDESWTPKITRFDGAQTDMTPPDASSNDREVIEAEVVNNDHQAADPSEDSVVSDSPQNQAPAQNMVFNQYGANSQQIGSVGTLNIGRGL